MMKLAAAAALICLLFSAYDAQARNRPAKPADASSAQASHIGPQFGPSLNLGGNLADRMRFYLGRNPTDMPRRWCGRVMRMAAPRDPGPVFDQARAWAKLGRPARPGPGVVVVWANHVGVIVHATRPGYAVVISGNTGPRGNRQVVEAERSISGAIAFRLL